MVGSGRPVGSCAPGRPRLPGFPVEVARARIDRAGVAATHGGCDIGGLDHAVGQRLGALWTVRALGWLRRHGRAIQVFGGEMLLVTGLWGQFIAWLRAPIGGYTTPL